MIKTLIEWLKEPVMMERWAEFGLIGFAVIGWIASWVLAGKWKDDYGEGKKRF